MVGGKFYKDEIEDIEDAALLVGLSADVDRDQEHVIVSVRPVADVDYILEKEGDAYVLIGEGGREVGRANNFLEVIALFDQVVKAR